MARALRTLALLVLALGHTPLRAAEPDGAPDAAPDAAQAPQIWSLNGFGTFGLAHSSEPKADFVFDNLQPKGAGFSRNWSNDIDTRLGVQLSANLDSHWSALLQLMSEYRWNGTYEPYVNWANVKYAFTPDFSVRIGRIALPSFMASNSRRVGYSNVAVRPPPEVYRLLVVNNSDGIDAQYRLRSGAMSNTITAVYGKKTVTNTRGIDVHSSGIAGLYDALEMGAVSAHIAYQVRHVDNQKPDLGKFMSVGASYDPGPWLLAGEWVRVSNYNGVGLEAVRAAWDVMAALRIERYTPYVVLADLHPLTDTGVAPIEQKTISAGVRWDCLKHIDVKLQFDHIHMSGRSVGTLQNFQPGFVAGGSLNIVSVAADFVF